MSDDGMLGEPDRTEPGDGLARSRPPARGSRLYPKLILGLLVIGGGYLLLQKLWTLGPSTTSWQFFAGACACGLLAILGWFLLAPLRSTIADSAGETRAAADQRDSRAPGLRAWLGFPLAFLGFLAMVPLLVLAVSTEARLRLDPGTRIRATLRGDRLEVLFPRATARPQLGEATVVNLTVGDTPIPVEFFADNPGASEWQDVAIDGDRRRLVVDYRRLEDAFDLEAPSRIGVNAILDAPQIRDASRTRFPQQWVEVVR